MIKNVISVLRWCQDREEGEMIEALDYRREYFGFGLGISQKDLDIICALVSPILIRANYSFTIGNHMGEIIPISHRT